MKKDSLLAFLTGKTNQAVTARFQAVLSDKESDTKHNLIKLIKDELTPEKKSLLDKAIDKAINLPGSNLPVFKSMKQEVEKAHPDFKRIEKLLDMSPEDVDSLFRVLKAPSDADIHGRGTQSGGDRVHLDVVLAPRHLKKKLSPPQIQKIVQDFDKTYSANAHYDPTTQKLTFDGVENTRDLLFEALEVLPASRKELSQNQASSADVDTFEIKILLKPSDLESNSSPSQISTSVGRFVDLYPDYFKKGSVKYSFTGDYKDNPLLTYKGPHKFLVQLLKYLGVKEDIIDSIETQGKKFSGTWEIAFDPKSNATYMQSWEDFQEFDGDLKTFFGKMSDSIAATNTKSAKIIEKNGIQLLWFKGTVSNLKSFLSQFVFDTHEVNEFISEFQGKQAKFRVKEAGEQNG